MHHLPLILQAFDGAQAWVCFDPAFLLVPFVRAVQLVQKGQEPGIAGHPVQDVAGVLILGVKDAVTHKSVGGDSEDQGLRSGTGALFDEVVQVTVFDSCQLINGSPVNVQAVQAGGVGGQGLDKAQIHRVVDVRHPAAQMLVEQRGELHHLFHGIIAQPCLVHLGGHVVDLGGSLPVIDQEIDLHSGCLSGLAVFTPLLNQRLVVTAQAIIVHKAENGLQPGLLEQLQLEGLAQAAGWDFAEPFDEIHMVVGYVVVKVPLAWVVEILQQTLTHLLDPPAGVDLAV